MTASLPEAKADTASVNGISGQRVPQDVHAAIIAAELGSASGAGSSFVWDKGTLQIYYGKASGLQPELFDDLSVPVQLNRTELSRDELEDEASRLARLGVLAPGTAVTYAAPEPDNSGIVVGVDATALTAQTQSSLQRILSNLTSVPVTVRATGRMVPATRQLDTTPFKAGARISHPGGRCTDSFAIGSQQIGPPGGINTEILTANHCSDDAVTWNIGNAAANPVLGISRHVAGDTDIMRLESPFGAPQANHAPFVYLGTWNNTSGIGAFVRNLWAPVVNDVWCMSGSYTGTVCANQVQETGATVCYGVFGPCYSEMVITQQTSGQSSAGNGDSGGPALGLTLRSDGGIDAHAAGVISGMRNPDSTSCIGVPGSTGGRQCSDIVLVAPVLQFLQDNAGYGVLVQP